MRAMRALRLGLALAATAGVLVAASAERVQGQAASPSVRAAARLKYNPPPNWIRHYLPDDRYKLAGGAWRVVSTETDSYYYPAWAPEMLRQSNGIVIGFPSSAAAEEAGYKRSRYPMDSPLLGLTGRPAPTPVPAPGAASGPFGGFSLPTGAAGGEVNRGKARRITLADGVSTAILPQGWSYSTQDAPQPPGATGARRQEFKLSVFSPGAAGVVTNETIGANSTARMVIFGFSQLPPGLRAETIFNANTLNRYRGAGRGGRVDTRNPAAGMMGGMTSARFGNITGVSFPYPVPNMGTVKLNIGGRGSKAYILVDISRGARGARDIINGFQGR